MAKNKKSVIEKRTFRQTPYEGKDAALYIRVSSKEFTKNEKGEKEKRQSVKTQTEDAIDYAKKNGWSYKVYDQDCNVSGGEEIEERPALQQLKADIEANRIHTVVIRELARFFRYESLQSWFRDKTLLPNGVDLKSLTEPDLNFHSSIGRLTSGIKGWQNEQYLIETAQKSIRSKQGKLTEGTLRTVPPFGYGIEERDGIRRCYVKDDEAKVIKDIFDRCAKGEGAQILIQLLMDKGIKPKRSSNLYSSNILRWIKNPIYKGIVRYNGKEYTSPYPAMVSAETWEKANSAIKARGSRYGIDRRKASNSHLLTGILQCGYCSDRLRKAETAPYKIYRNYILAIGKTWVKRNGKFKRANYPVYRCQTKYKHHAISCPNSISIKADYIETRLKEWVGNLIANQYEKELAKFSPQLEKLKSQRVEIETKITRFKERQENTVNRYANLDIDEATLTAINLKLKDNIRKNETELTQVLKDIDTLSGIATKDALKSLSKWDKLTIEQKKNGLTKLFDCILVYNDRLEVFNRGNPQPFTMYLKYEQQKGHRIDAEKTKDGYLMRSNYRFSNIRPSQTE